MDEDESSEEVNMDKLADAHEQIDNLPVRGIEEETDEVERVAPIDNIAVKYRTEAEVSKPQEPFFDKYRSEFGRHVAFSNTQRKDNIRHLNALDLQYLYARVPVLRHLGNEIRVRETSEFQMCRSNPEIGGFEAKLGVTMIKNETVDVKQAQSLFRSDGQKKKSGGILGFLKR